VVMTGWEAQEKGKARGRTERGEGGVFHFQGVRNARPYGKGGWRKEDFGGNGKESNFKRKGKKRKKERVGGGFLK